MDGSDFPSELDELVPKYLKKLPLDPFTGETLRYHVDESGCLIYSLGPNKIDDGGRRDPKASEDDISIRLAR